MFRTAELSQKKFMKPTVLLILFLLLIGCRTENRKSPNFENDITEGPKPWTGESFELEEEDFTFAIISDLNGGEREGVYSQAVAQLNRLDPTFVLSVGDLIDGGTEDSVQLAKEWESFDMRTAKLNMPFFYLGGNHDLTNPVMRKFWKQRYGPRYYHFVYEDVLFLMIDSEDYTEKRMMEIYEARARALKIIKGEIAGSYEESEYYQMPERRIGGMSMDQINYFKEVLQRYPKVKWTFLLMHKPLWMREDEQGLGALEETLQGRNYTVINGHFHSLSHRIRNNMDYMILGTTGGSQFEGDAQSFDHVTLVRMDSIPVITHLRMDGILNEEGITPGSLSPWVTTESGLQYQILEEGQGEAAKNGDLILLRETTSYTDGKLIFDSGTMPEPLKVEIGAHQVIQGVEEGLLGMKKGERRKLIVPPELSRRTSYPDSIHPDSTLVYVLNLIDIKK